MPTVAQNSFVGGEIAPSLYGRTDLAKYATSVRRMRNFITHPHGGASNRGGTEYIAEVKTSSKEVRLIPFTFSVVQAYILEFGDQYMRVYMSGGQVQSGGSPYEIVTPYLEADLPLLKYTQSADVLYITHPSYAPRKLTRTGHTSWTLSTITFGPSISAPTSLTGTGGSGTALNFVVTAVNDAGEESIASNVFASGNGVALSWTGSTGALYYNIYQDDRTSGTYGFIGQAANTTFTVPAGGIIAEYDTCPPTANNPFSGTDDYPGVCTFYDQRLLFARTNNDPQKVWASVIGSFDNLNYCSPIKDDDAFSFTINARQVNEVRFLVPLESVIMGTSGSEWKLSPGGSTDTITPTSLSVKMQSQWGVSDVQPLVVGNTVLFIGSSGSVIRDLLYSLDLDGYTGNDLTIMGNHLFRDHNLVDWAYQKDPDSIIWCVRDDGKLLGLTYFKEHEVWGWHLHETDGDIEAIASHTTGTGFDEVYMVVKRQINGATKRYVERFRQRLPADTIFENNVRDAFFVDCGLSLNNPVAIEGATAADPVVITQTGHSYSNGDYIDIAEVYGMTELNNKRFIVANADTNTFELTDLSGNDVDGSAYSTYLSGGYTRKAYNSVSGLGHLEGEAVAVLADGDVVNGLTVSSGAITLPNSKKASRIHIGLPYASTIETLDLEYQTEQGTVQDKLRTVESVLVRLEETRALKVGPDEDNLDEILFRTTEAYNEPTALFSGDKEQLIEAGNERESRVVMYNSDPLPVTILSLYARITHGEES